MLPEPGAGALPLMLFMAAPESELNCWFGSQTSTPVSVVEERFHKDFDAVDFTSIGSIKAGRARSAGQTSYPAGLLVRHSNHEPSLASEF